MPGGFEPQHLLGDVAARIDTWLASMKMAFGITLSGFVMNVCEYDATAESEPRGASGHDRGRESQP